MAKTYKSEAFAALHESMSGLHQVGAIDSKTMREFDRACLPPVIKLSPATSAASGRKQLLVNQFLRHT